MIFTVVILQKFNNCLVTYMHVVLYGTLLSVNFCLHVLQCCGNDFISWADELQRSNLWQHLSQKQLCKCKNICVCMDMGTLNTWPLGTEKDSIFTQNAKLVSQSLNNVHLVCAVCMNLVVGGEFMYDIGYK